MIISLFGPDGVGKSTVSRQLAKRGYYVFSGTGVASWPDKTWINDLVAKGIDEKTYDDEAHFLEKIERCHRLSRELETTYKNVVIDSDPFHKTYLHDILRQRGDRLKHLFHLAYPKPSKRMHVCIMIDDQDDKSAATELQKRIASRGLHEHFDPKSVKESEAMILASRKLCSMLEEMGEQIVIASTAAEVVALLESREAELL